MNEKLALNKYRVEVDMTYTRILRRKRYWWRLVCRGNNETLATSQMYKTVCQCDDTSRELALALKCARNASVDVLATTGNSWFIPSQIG